MFSFNVRAYRQMFSKLQSPDLMFFYLFLNSLQKQEKILFCLDNLTQKKKREREIIDRNRNDPHLQDIFEKLI